MAATKGSTPQADDPKVEEQMAEVDSKPKTYCKNCNAKDCCNNRPHGLDPNEDHFCAEHATMEMEVDRYSALDMSVTQDEGASEELLVRLTSKLSKDNIIRGEVRKIDGMNLIHWTIPPAKLEEPEGQREVLTVPMVNELIDVYQTPKENEEDKLWREMEGHQDWDKIDLGKFLKKSFEKEGLLEDLESLAEIVENECVKGSRLKDWAVDDFEKKVRKATKQDNEWELTTGQKAHYVEILKVANTDARPKRKKGRYMHINIGGVFDEEGTVHVDPWNKTQIQLDDYNNISLVQNLERHVYHNPETSLYLITSDVAPVYPADRDIFDAWQGSQSVDHANKRINAANRQKDLTDKLIAMADA